MKNRSVCLSIVTIVFIASANFLWAQAQTSNNVRGGGLSAPPGPALLEDEPLVGSASKPHDASFIIGNDDLLAINVWKEPELTRSIPVRLDGRISLPLVGEVQAAGRTPLELEDIIANRLRSYIAEPEVTVMIEKINSQKFNVLGQVMKPGSYSLTLATTVLDGIAAAGGFRDFAKQKSIYVLRQNPGGGQSRIAFNYKEIIKGEHLDQNIKLMPRDTIVVP